MKKCTAFLLVLVMVLSILPTAAFAASPVSDFEYQKLGNRVIIKKYIGNKPEVVIPDTIEGKPVTAIDREAFKDNSRIISVKMPKNLHEIGDEAFAGCINLQFVVFTGRFVQNFGNNVFSSVYAAQLILPIGADNLLPQEGKKVRWLGGTFDVISVENHICHDIFHDGIYARDNKCDICGRPMNGSNPGASRNSCDLAVSIGKAAVRTAATVGTAVAVTTVKAVKTTAIVVRSILKWF